MEFFVVVEYFCPGSVGVKYADNLFIAIHYNTFRISNISCGFEVLFITMTIYCSVVNDITIVIA